MVQRLSSVKQMLCSVARVNGHRLQKGTQAADDCKHLIKVASNLSTVPLSFDDCPTVNVSKIADAARQMKRHEIELELVVIDFLQQCRNL